MQWKNRWSLAALVMATASCNAAAQLPPATTIPTTTTTVPLTPAEAAAEFHSCLTQQGLTVPDVPLDDQGRPDLSALADASAQNSAQWHEALTACAAVIVANGALDLSADPALAEAVRTRLMAFSACMRSQGVESFPDPPADFDGTSPPFLLSAIPVADPELAPAIEACVVATAGPG